MRSLPSISSLLESGPVAGAISAGAGRADALLACREVVARARAAARRGQAPPPGALAEEAGALAARRSRLGVSPAVNATGVVLHTGLGRAVLAPAASAAASAAVAGYSTVEVDEETGGRGRRDARIESLLCSLTGAPAATVVNNNAAAVVLALHALCLGREVILSRGEMVEIGGSFRMPDVMEASGALLREVGTTNRTRLSDYARAVGPRTAAILRVHTSNFRIVGFAERPGIGELAALARRRRIRLISDAGSGDLLGLESKGLPGEPFLADELRAGAHVVTASGDKLLGGPQAGIVLGTRRDVAAMRADPLWRAFRVGKFTLAALEATLRLFRDPARLPETHPTTAMLLATKATLRSRARALARRIRAAAPSAIASVRDDASEAGSGALPATPLPTSVVALALPGRTASELASALRRHVPPVFARIRGDRVLFDPRTILSGQDRIIAAAVAAIPVA